MLAIALLCCASSAAAGTWSDALPPDRFRGSALAMVRVVPEADVQVECEITPPEGYRIVACARRGAAPRTIILPDPCPFAESGEIFARRACHEFAHIRGWSSDHPN